MKRIVFLFFIICSLEAFAQGSSTLDKKCKAQGFNCGECDTNIQNDFNKILTDITDATPTERWSDLGKTQDNSNIKMKPGVTLEDTLQKIIDMMKKGNPAGENKINPRIMVKIPNSELIVTFNTNPDDQGSKTLEIMRWNGKEGKCG